MLLVIILGAWTWFAFGRSSEPLAQNDEATQQSEDMSKSTIPESSTDQTAQAGVYTSYSENALAETSGTRILFFHAPWCPQCRSLDKDITENGAPAGTTIFKVDYDSSQDLRKKYGVTIQTTLVLIDGEGNLVKKFVAYSDPTVASVIENLL